MPCCPQISQGDDRLANLRRFAEIYCCNGVECMRDYKLVANNELFVEQQNCFKAIWCLFFAQQRMTSGDCVQI